MPHGEVRIKPYVSKALGVSRTVWVYTPPDYAKKFFIDNAKLMFPDL